MLLKITESLPRKSAVSPVYNSPPKERKNVFNSGKEERVKEREREVRMNKVKEKVMEL